MRKFKFVLTVLLILGGIFPLLVWASDGPSATDALAAPESSSTSAIEKRLESLEKEIALLKKQLEMKKEEEVKKVVDTPIITANAKDGFSIKSADENYKLKIGGYVQTDGRFFLYNNKDLGVDTFTVRRARLIFEGTVGKNLSFYIVPDFGGGNASLVDAYGEYALAPQLKIKGGKFKVPFGLERLQSDKANNFVELGLTDNLVPNREVGAQVSGDILKETVNYNVGVFNGFADNSSSTSQDVDNNNDKDIVGRVFVQPFKNEGPDIVKGLGVGLAGSYGHNEGSTLPTYKSTGQASIFSYSSGVSADGLHARITPQVYYSKGSLGVIGEYVQSQQKVVRTSSGNIIREKFNNTAWQISGNYVLTGELASFKGVVPAKDFDLAKGGWGAVDVVGRFEHLSIDNSIFSNGFASLATAVSGADAWGVGTNWYLNRNLRLSLDFEQTKFDRGALSGNRKTEDVVLTRLQVAY